MLHSALFVYAASSSPRAADFVIRHSKLACKSLSGAAMCILFVHVNPSPSPGQYKVVLATNRDEFFSRPSVPADFWKENGDILGGRDITENKEGGTWLAVSKHGKIGVVLNLSGGRNDAEKQGRGFLIADYLTSSSSPAQHMESLKSISQRYNKFHLVAIQFDKTPVLSHYCNGEETEQMTVLREGTFAVGNSRLDRPYEKVKKGRERFDEIVARHSTTKSQAELVEELLSLLKSDDKHKDPTGEEMSHLPEGFREQCCSVFINVPTAGYGTRTHTIILVDNNAETDFYEWTLKEPIPPNVSDREWICSHHRFPVGS